MRDSGGTWRSNGVVLSNALLGFASSPGHGRSWHKGRALCGARLSDLTKIDFQSEIPYFHQFQMMCFLVFESFLNHFSHRKNGVFISETMVKPWWNDQTTRSPVGRPVGLPSACSADTALRSSRHPARHPEAEGCAEGLHEMCMYLYIVLYIYI